MKAFVILVHLFGASFAIPLVAQRLLSASNSNELLLELVNRNLAQGNAMNLLVPGILQQQMQPKMPGLIQVPFGTRTGLAAQLPNQVSFNGQVQPLTPLQNQQPPNQMMPYVVSYGLPQQQGQVQYYPLYPQQQQPGAPAIPKQLGPQQPLEQNFGCLVPQLNGDVITFEKLYPGALQLPTKSPDDPLTFNENPTVEPLNLEDKAYPKLAKESQMP